MLILLILNFLSVLVAPHIAIHNSSEGNLAGAWKGVMGQKNWAGFVSAITVLLFVFNPMVQPKALRIAIIFGAAAFLVLTQSVTSIIICVVALVCGTGLRIQMESCGWRPIASVYWAWMPLGICGLFFATLAISPELYLARFDPEAFSGRTQIWEPLIRVYVEHPLTGTGFGSIWNIGDNNEIARYAKSWVANQGEGHNGYLDLLVQIGAPGTMLVLFAALVWPLGIILRGGEHRARPLGMALLVFCLGHNLTESTLFDRDAVGQVVMMVSIAIIWSVTPIAVPTKKRSKPRSNVRRKHRKISTS